MPAIAIKATQRSTFTLRPKARLIAEQRAKIHQISFGEAVSDLLEEAEANRPQTRIEIRNGLPVMVGPPGAPIVTCEMVKDILDNEW